MFDFRTRRTLILYILMTIFLIIFFAPILYMLTTSLTPNEEQILKNMATFKAFIPTNVGLNNYIDVFERMPFGRFLFNSIFIVSTTILFGLVVNSMAAFALARFQFKGRNLIISTVLALMIIPFEAIAVPLLLITNRLGWLDSYHVQIIPFIANPFYIFLLYQFFINFPKELEEAAIIDGASWYKIYYKLAIPLSKPILASVAILHFLMQWKRFLWPLMVTRGPAFRPLTVAMQVFFGQYPRLWGDIMAFAAMMTLPIVILFIILQDRYVSTVARSGIK
ncbi:MAG: carbohydrate ABC transporter permease [Halanaerobiales bacterium]|nr:carbohydrate ABC transporter permease [Halanaerobiales bacterium]